VAWKYKVSKQVQSVLRYFLRDPALDRDDVLRFLNRLYELLENCPDSLRLPQERRLRDDPSCFLLIRPLVIGHIRHYFRFAVNDTVEPGTLLVLRVHHIQRDNPDP
jgi:hypothetical protein